MPKHGNFSSHSLFSSALPLLGHSHTLLEVFSFLLMMRMSALIDILTLFSGQRYNLERLADKYNTPGPMTTSEQLSFHSTTPMTQAITEPIVIPSSAEEPAATGTGSSGMASGVEPGGAFVIMTMVEGASSVVEGQPASVPAGFYPAPGDLLAPRPRSVRDIRQEQEELSDEWERTLQSIADY